MKRDWFSGTTIAEIISLGMLRPIEPGTWQRIYRSFTSCQKFLEAGDGGWCKAKLNSVEVAALTNRPTNVVASERLLVTKDIHLITIDDSSYPSRLRTITEPPLWLYYRGNIALAQQRLLTAIGNLKPSSYALGVLNHLLTPKLSRITAVVSGLGYGLEKLIQEKYLLLGGKTVAVLAGGLDSIQPTDHFRLADKIVASGGVLISEYPPLDRAAVWKQPAVRRLLVGLSSVSLVIEVGTEDVTDLAQLVNKYRRDLLVVPGDINRRQAAGANQLIKNGATLLSDARQLEKYAELEGEKAERVSSR